MPSQSDDPLPPDDLQRLAGFESHELPVSDTQWIRDLVAEEGLKDGDLLAIVVHAPGERTRNTPPKVFDLFLDSEDESDLLIRNKPFPLAEDEIKGLFSTRPPRPRARPPAE